MNVDLETIDHNLAGEILRDVFFDQKLGLGCYVSFHINDNIRYENPVPIPWWNLEVSPPKVIFDSADPDDPRAFTKYIGPDNIICLWEWEGDGCLIFILPSGICLYNNDCKKTNNWRSFDSFEEIWQGNNHL